MSDVIVSVEPDDDDEEPITSEIARMVLSRVLSPHTAASIIEDLEDEVDRLLARNETLVDLLKRAQWGNTGACPECHALAPIHDPGCEIAEVLFENLADG